MGEDVDDRDQAGDPADNQDPEPVAPGVRVEGPHVLLVVPAYEVDSLQDIRHGVPEADGEVEQDDLQDDQLAEGGVEPTFAVDRIFAGSPLSQRVRVSLVGIVKADSFLLGGAGRAAAALNIPSLLSHCESDCHNTFNLLVIILLLNILRVLS